MASEIGNWARASSYKIDHLLIWDEHRILINTFKSSTLIVEEEGDGTVIDLIGDGEGGVIVVGGTEEQDVLWNEEFTFLEIDRIVILRCRNQVDQPVVGYLSFP